MYTNYNTNLNTNYYTFTELQTELPKFKNGYQQGIINYLIYKFVKCTLKID